MFLKTAIFYRDIPVNYVVAVKAPLADMNTAAAAGDAKSFVAAYEKLTAAYNACHRAANVGFIVMTTRPPALRRRDILAASSTHLLLSAIDDDLRRYIPPSCH